MHIEKLFGKIAYVVSPQRRICRQGLIFVKEVLTVAKCSICEKGAHFGNNVSHSHRRSNRMWKSNIKSVKAVVNGTPKKIYVCTQCLKSGKVERA